MLTNNPSQQPNRHTITWNDFNIAVGDIVDQIIHSRAPQQIVNDLFVGVPAGGLPLMTAVTSQLRILHKFPIIPAKQFMLLSPEIGYNDRQRIFERYRTINAHPNPCVGKIWLFEDIIDTGSTINELIAALTVDVGPASLLPSDIEVCTLVNRTQVRYYQAFWLPFDPSVFIEFPWDPPQ